MCKRFLMGLPSATGTKTIPGPTRSQGVSRITVSSAHDGTIKHSLSDSWMTVQSRACAHHAACFLTSWQSTTSVYHKVPRFSRVLSKRLRPGDPARSAVSQHGQTREPMGCLARIVASWEHAARDLDWKMRHNHVGHGAQRVLGSPVVAALTRPSAAAPREPGLVLVGDVETPTRAIPDEHPMRCNGDVARGCGAVAGACPSPHVRVRHRHRVA